MNNYIATLGIVFAFGLPNAVNAQSVTPPPVPANLEVEAPNQAFLLGRGIGTQNYVCRPVQSLGRVDWVLFTPQATLFGDGDVQLTTHFFGPNPVENGTIRAAWQDSLDTSTVWGRVIASSFDPAFVKAGAIPWLLVEATGTQAGPTGGETLSQTTFIQRVNTEGGAAPPTGCDQPQDIGSTAFVPYAADYFFYKK
jgi:hypothetical protein